jgi:hypothetical protein
VITYKFFRTYYLDLEQVRVIEVEPTYFVVKAARQLTDREVKGAIVKYLISKGRTLPNPDA